MYNQSEKILGAEFVAINMNEMYNVQGGDDKTLVDSVKQLILTLFHIN